MPAVAMAILALAAAGEVAAQAAGPSVESVRVVPGTGSSAVTVTFDRAIAAPGQFGAESQPGLGDHGDVAVSGQQHSGASVQFSIDVALKDGEGVRIAVPGVASAADGAATSPATSALAINYEKAPGAPTASFTSERTITVVFDQVMRLSTLDSDATATGLQASVRAGTAPAGHLGATFGVPTRPGADELAGTSTLSIELAGTVPLSTVHSVRITTSMQNHNGLAIAQDTEAQATSQVARASHGDDAHTIEVTFAEAVSAASVPETITVRPDGDRGGTEADVEDIAGASASSITLRLGERAVAPAFHEIDLPASISYADGSPEFGGGTVTATFPGPRFGAAIRSATEIRVDFLEPVGFTAASGATAPLLSEWRVSLDPRSPGALTAPVAVSELGGMTRFTITMPSSLNSGRGLVLGTEPVVRYVPAGDPSIEGAGGRALLENTAALAAYAVPPLLTRIERIGPEFTLVTFTDEIGGTTGVDDWRVTDYTGEAGAARAVVGVGTAGAGDPADPALPALCVDEDTTDDVRTGPGCELALHKPTLPRAPLEDPVGSLVLRHARVDGRGAATPDSVSVTYTGSSLYGLTPRGDAIRVGEDDARVPSGLAGTVSQTFDALIDAETLTTTTTRVGLENPDGSEATFSGLVDVAHWSVEGGAAAGAPTRIDVVGLVPASNQDDPPAPGTLGTATAGAAYTVPPATPASHLVLTHADTGSTATTPTVGYTAPPGEPQEGDPPPLSTTLAGRAVRTVSAVAADGVDPVLSSARTSSTGSLVVTLSEPVGGTADAGRWTVAGAQNLAVASARMTLALTYDDTHDASLAPAVTYARPASGGLADISGNRLAGGTVTAADGVAPRVVSAQTASATSLTVTLSEGVTGATAAGEWTALHTREGAADISARITGASASGSAVTLVYDEIADTSFAPTVTYTPPPAGGLADAASNGLGGGPVTAADRLAPEARSASFVDSRTIDVAFSEPVTLAGTWSAVPTLGELTASQGAPRGTVRLALAGGSGTTDAAPGMYVISVPPEVADAANPPNSVPAGHTVPATYASPFSATTRSLTEVLVDFGGAALAGTLDIDDWAVVDGGTARGVDSVAALNAAGAEVAAARAPTENEFEATATVPAGTHTRLLITLADGLAGSDSTPRVTYREDNPGIARPGGSLSAGGAVLRTTPVDARDGIAPSVLSARTASTTSVAVTLSEGVTGTTAAGEWTVNGMMAASVGAGAAAGSDTAALAGGDELTLSLSSALRGDATPAVRYVAPSGMAPNQLVDGAGLAMASTPAGSPVTAADGVAPVPLSASFVTPRLILVTFSEAVTAGSAWSVSPALGTVAASSESPDPTVRLVTQSAAAAGDTGTREYTITVPAGIDDLAGIPNGVDLSGGDTLAAAYARPAAAPEITGARTTSRTTTVVEFDQSLDTGTLGKGDWTVTGASSLEVASVRLGEHAAAAGTPQASIALDHETTASSVTLVHAPLAHTGVTPSVAYAPGTLGRSDAVPQAVAARTVEAADATPPAFSARWEGAVPNGIVIVEFSEPVYAAAGKSLPEPYPTQTSLAGDWTATGTFGRSEARSAVLAVDYALGSRPLSRGDAPPELLAATYLSDTQARLTFSEALDPASVAPEAFSLSGPGGPIAVSSAALDAALAPATIRNTVTLTLASPGMGADGTYTATAVARAGDGPGVTDAGGAALAGTERRALARGAAPPELLAATYLSDTQVRLTFSEAIAEGSVAPEAFSLSGPGGSIEVSSADLDAARGAGMPRNTVTLTLAAPDMAADGEYTATALSRDGDGAGVLDAEGNALHARTATIGLQSTGGGRFQANQRYQFIDLSMPFTLRLDALAPERENSIVDAAGHPVADGTGADIVETVGPEILASTSVDGVVRVEFSETVIPGTTARAADWALEDDMGMAIAVDGVSRPVPGAVASDSTALASDRAFLIFHEPRGMTDTFFTLTYTRPPAAGPGALGDGEALITDRSLNAIASLGPGESSSVSIRDGIPPDVSAIRLIDGDAADAGVLAGDGGALAADQSQTAERGAALPALQAATYLSDTQARLTFSEAIEEASVAPGAFSLSGPGGAIAVSSASLDAALAPAAIRNTVTLTLASPGMDGGLWRVGPGGDPRRLGRPPRRGFGVPRRGPRAGGDPQHRHAHARGPRHGLQRPLRVHGLRRRPRRRPRRHDGGRL